MSIVEQEVVIRKLRFASGSYIVVSDGMISFESVQVEDELTVDDAQRTSRGKRLRIDGEV